jgi:hypothetical protein
MSSSPDFDKFRARYAAIMDTTQDLTPASVPILLKLLTNPENTSTELTVLRGALIKVNDPRALAVVNAVGISGRSPIACLTGSTDLDDSLNVRISEFDADAMAVIGGHIPPVENQSDAVRFALTFTAMMLNAAFEDGKLQHE